MIPTSDQIYKEIHAVINRYSHESDVTAAQILGILQMVNADLLDQLKCNSRPKTEDEI